MSCPNNKLESTKKISIALRSNPNIRLGFDACCNCATPLKGSNKDDVCCKVCRRVWYCSKECRREDAESYRRNQEEEDEEQGKGHSAIICSLLKLCNIDEEVEEEFGGGSNENEENEKKSKKGMYSDEEKRAAIDRISSEYESYPATLANVLMDAPCFEPALDKFLVKRRGKKTRQLDLEEDEKLSSHNNNTLSIHVIGASRESELWGDFQLDKTNAMNAYTDALSELASTYKGLKKINLTFIGPDCPAETLHVVKTFDNDLHNNSTGENNSSEGGKKRKREEGKRKHCQLVIETHRHNYEAKYFKTSSAHIKKKGKHSLLPRPDIVVFFNPGFTCPDYDWSEALKACQCGGIDGKTPFIVTTNTEMEAIADVQYLYQHGYIDSLPPIVADIVNEGKIDHDSNAFDSSKNTIFFGENVHAGTRVRQSGNMANDCYVKNQYILGGHLSHKIDSKTKKESKKGTVDSSKQKTDVSGPDSNSKKNNAALM
mmetsp:Transcript_20985/g.31513  ORF Transcript_20985/g.31513 Transcript_20985/m.31513 type:complete len:487 (-) Transcript_20985:73-1533(-)